MIWILKKYSAAITAIAAFGLFLFFFEYGEYDKRDLPSKIMLTTSAKGDHHIHAYASFYPARNIPGLCVKIMGMQLGSTIEESYPDIPASGVEITTKKKWAGFCEYKLDQIFITCTNTKQFPGTNNGITKWAGIGILNKGDKSIDMSGVEYESSSVNKIENNALNILIENGKNYFFACDSGCEDNRALGMDRTNRSLKVSCEDETQ